ncbi:MAG: DNA-directed RNA polymerase subunit omega [Bacteroidales bacterium]|nr:DNA-directed RNA polymerase subunit omega [Bacteroidales bacterium]
MDYKKITTETTAESYNVVNFEEGTDNIYESLAILARRANQIGLEIKEELNEKVSEFQTSTDTLEEVFENREQIEIARYYERLPKPTLMAIHEFLNHKVYHRNPVKESSKDNF